VNIDVDLPALRGFEEFDEMPALVSEEFEEAPRFLAVPIDLLWRNTVHYHYPCLGLFSHQHLPDRPQVFGNPQ
jgi:hypothetical protein